MNDQEYLVAKSHELINAPTVCKEAKEAAKKWLQALGTSKEKEASQAYVKELEEDIVPIDGLIAFASSPEAKKEMGEKEQEGLLKHALEIKAQGVKYCDCPACSLAQAILLKKGELLK